MDSADYMRKLANDMLEATLQERIRLLARQFGWLYYHTHLAKHSPAGFPDGVLLRGDRLIFEESKRQAPTKRNQPSPAQQEWLDALGHIAELLRICGPIYDPPRVEVYVWRPLDVLDGTIARILA